MNIKKGYFSFLDLINILLIILCSELYLFPFDSYFRFSLGVLVLGIVLLFSDKKKLIPITLLSSLGIFGIRYVLYRIPWQGAALQNALIGGGFYLLFGLLFYWMIDPKKLGYYQLFLRLAALDVGLNLLEITIRGIGSSQHIRFIIMVGLVRGMMMTLVYFVIAKNKAKAVEKERQENNEKLYNLVSNINSEFFYLKKIAQDIELVMSQSYSLYNQLGSEAPLSLNIATEIHEIKKDLMRTLNVFSGLVEDFSKTKAMALNEINQLLLPQYLPLKDQGISITIAPSEIGELIIQKYYYLFTIINNLVTNAIEANAKNIVIHQSLQDEVLFIQVTDDGDGIPKELLELVTLPGFTTKFDPTTGSQNTGIGLPHIQSILDNLGGKIEIQSIAEKHTTTIGVHIPYQAIGGPHE